MTDYLEKAYKKREICDRQYEKLVEMRAQILGDSDLCSPAFFSPGGLAQPAARAEITVTRKRITGNNYYMRGRTCRLSADRPAGTCNEYEETAIEYVSKGKFPAKAFQEIVQQAEATKDK